MPFHSPDPFALIAAWPAVVVAAALVSSPAQPPRQAGNVPSVSVVAVRTTPATDVLRPCVPKHPPSSDSVARLGRASPGLELVPADGTWLPGGVPDHETRAEAEREIAKSGKYRVAMSPDDADLVLLLQTSWRADVEAQVVSADPDQPPTAYFYPGAPDEQPNQLVAEVALAVPGAEYRRDPNDTVALLKAAVWEAHNGGCFNLATGWTTTASLAARFARNNRPHTVTGLWSPPHLRRASSVPFDSAAPLASDKVAVPVLVTDSQGDPVLGLRASDFRVFEEEAEQKIESLAPDHEPVNVALLLDSSASMRRAFGGVKAAASALFDTLPSADRVMALSFDSKVRMFGDWTTDREAVRSLLPPMTVGGDSTRLYDAIAAALDRVDGMAGLKSMLLLTDGLDLGSGFASYATILARLQASNVPIDVVQIDTTGGGTPLGFATPPKRFHAGKLPVHYFDKSSLFAQAAEDLRTLCRVTGGRFESVASGGEAADRALRIAKVLHHRYVLSYSASRESGNDRPRRIRVVVVGRPDLTVVSRTGYALTKTPHQRPGE